MNTPEPESKLRSKPTLEPSAPTPPNPSSTPLPETPLPETPLPETLSDEDREAFTVSTNGLMGEIAEHEVNKSDKFEYSFASNCYIPKGIDQLSIDQGNEGCELRKRRCSGRA